MQNRHYSIEEGLQGVGVRNLSELTLQVQQWPDDHYRGEHSPSQQVPGILKSRERKVREITKDRRSRPTLLMSSARSFPKVFSVQVKSKSQIFSGYFFRGSLSLSLFLSLTPNPKEL